MIRFRMPIQKKVQAVGVLLRLTQNRMDRLRLLQLLYIADRESLQQRGVPIIGGTVSALDNGPLHSEIYDLIKGKHIQEQQWLEFVENDGYAVVLKQDPGRELLSPYEIDKLTEVSERYRNLDSWEVAEETHKLKEWIDLHQEGASKTIPLDRILDALGFTPDEIEHVQADAEATARMSQLLTRQTDLSEETTVR